MSVLFWWGKCWFLELFCQMLLWKPEVQLKAFHKCQILLFTIISRFSDWEKLLSEVVLALFFSHGCALRQNREWADSLHTNGVRMLYCVMAALTFSSDALNIWKGKWSETVTLQSSPWTFCRTLVCPWCLSWRGVASSLLPFLTPGHRPTASSLCEVFG